MVTLESMVSTMVTLQTDNQQLKYEMNIMQGAMSTAVTAQDLQALKDAHDAVILVADQKCNYTSPTLAALEARISELIVRMDQMEIRGAGPSSRAAGGRGWQLSRPKDMEPSEFSGKEEDWLRWKDSTEDYVDTVHPGMKQVLHLAAKANSQVSSRIKLNITEEEWNLAGTSSHC